METPNILTKRLAGGATVSAIALLVGLATPFGAYADDTVGAVTYFDPDKGFEASFAAGVVLNTQNKMENQR
jgi:hypothetical protein